MLLEKNVLFSGELADSPADIVVDIVGRVRQFKSLTAIGNATLPELERILPKDAAAAVYHHFRAKEEE